MTLVTRLNGEEMQRTGTDDLLFGVPELIAYMSSIAPLQPGDVISTGTPPGVGMGMKPQRFLKPGDVMTLGVAGLGQQKQTLVKAKR